MRARVFPIVTLLALLALAAPIPASLAQQADDDTGRLPLKLEAPEIDQELLSGDVQRSRLAARSSPVRVLIELQAAPTARVYAESLKRGDKAKATAEAKAAQAAIERAQQAVVRELESPRIGATVYGRTQRVFNGIAARVARGKLGEIARLPGVKAIKPTRTITLDNASGVPLVQAPQVWASAAAGNATGTGISIGIIDTGIDYIHTDFGGPGTDAAYTEAGDATRINDGAYFPSAKVVGGRDFIGDEYEGGDDDPILPDPDPIDCNGHGTHVAGSAGGFGVNADGSTYTGPWNASTPFDELRIGPGVAPRAELWAIKVFSCAGSTPNDVVIQGIEYAVDPNGDGDFADRLDVINMSLGSNFGDPYEPDVIAVNNASDVGVIAAVAAGNDGDTFYIVGGPGTADKAITVAGVVDELNVLDGFVVNSPPAIAGVKPGANSINFVWTPPPPAPPVAPVTDDLVYPPSQRSGCQAFTPANAALMAGKIALLDWTETSPGVSECNSGVRVNNAAAAGARGVVFDYGKPDIDAAFGGSASIPSVYTAAQYGAQLKANLAAGVVVTLTPEYDDSVESRNPGQVDSVYTATSRGPGSTNNILKPDIAGPAVTIFSAATLTGSEGDSFSGTSMATPHVAGGMALLRQIHPSWTVEELKALAMNTASAPVRQNADPASLRLGPQRVGANRMTLAEAIASQVVAYNADDAGRVSVSFGAVEVLGSTTAVKNVRVVNKGSASATYNVSYQPIVDVPGVTFSVSPASVTVPAGGTANVAVTMQATAAQLPHAYDPSISLTQSDLPRHWLTEESGHAVLTPAGGTTLRVPLYVAARAASDMHATRSALATGTGPSANLQIELGGTPVGSGQALLTPAATDEVSLVTAFELQHSSPNDAGSPAPLDKADLQYVGVYSDYPAARSIGDPDAGGPGSGTTLAFGVAMHGDWSTPQAGYETTVDVLIDTNRDGTPDYDLFNYDLASLLGLPSENDVFLAVLLNLNDDSAPITFEYLNGLPSSTLNTVPYNTNLMMLPVTASALGLTDANAGFNYQVVTGGDFESDVELSPVLSYNAAAPGLDLSSGQAGLPAYLDLPGTNLAVNYNRANYEAARSQGVLLLHHLNTRGRRTDVVRLQSTFRNMLPLVSVAR